MHKPVAAAVAAVKSELLMISPYLIPGDEGMQLFADLRKRGVKVQILTSSLGVERRSSWPRPAT